jgi:hypothetical protein
MRGEEEKVDESDGEDAEGRARAVAADGVG